MINPLLFLLITTVLFIIALYVTAPLITTFHELGHALAHLLLVKTDRIDVFIGSHGDESNKIQDWQVILLCKIYFFGL